MGPIAWSASWLLVCIASVVVVVISMRLRRQCRSAGSRAHVAAVSEELTPKMAKRPKTAFFWAFLVTAGYWACMLAFYLVSLGSTKSLQSFFVVWELTTIPAVVVSLSLTFWFLNAGKAAVTRSTVRGPVVTGIEARAGTMAAGWLGVALFATLFAITAYSKGF